MTEVDEHPSNAAVAVCYPVRPSDLIQVLKAAPLQESDANGLEGQWVVVIQIRCDGPLVDCYQKHEMADSRANARLAWRNRGLGSDCYHARYRRLGGLRIRVIVEELHLAVK